MNAPKTSALKFADYNTLAGTPHGERPRWNLLQRAGAAAHAGIDTIGVHIDDMQGDPWALQCEFFAHGVKAGAVEWHDLDKPHDHLREADMWKLVDVLHIPQVNAGVCGTGQLDRQILTGALYHLANRAARHGASIAVEPVCFGSLWDIGDVQDVVRAVRQRGAQNVGTLLDVFHLARMRWSADVSGIDVSLVAGVQVCGVRRTRFGTDLLDDAQNYRVLATEGEFPVKSWLANLYRAGMPATTPVSHEILSAEMRQQNVYYTAEVVAASMSALTAAAVPA